MPFKKGDSVVAKVELFPNEFSYIIGKVDRDQSNAHVKVVDPEPEPDQPNSKFDVTEDVVYHWPPSKEVTSRYWQKGEPVLSLVYLDDLNEWSSVLYRGFIAEVKPEGKPSLRIVFEDDNSIADIPAHFVLPEKITVHQAEPETETQSPSEVVDQSLPVPMEEVPQETHKEDVPKEDETSRETEQSAGIYGISS
ncbi:hypothetical protein GEMRC1_014185 [Eukaryota sp. GEM-RC1]